MTQKIKMIKSKSDEVPNGSIGEIWDNDDITKPGLHLVFFGDYMCFVYPHEIELIEE